MGRYTTVISPSSRLLGDLRVTITIVLAVFQMDSSWLKLAPNRFCTVEDFFSVGVPRLEATVSQTKPKTCPPNESEYLNSFPLKKKRLASARERPGALGPKSAD